MRKVNSKVTINKMAIKKIEKAAEIALAQTAEFLHSEVVQAQVVPREKGTLQNEEFFIDTSEVSNGKVKLVHNTPYARRLYFHPEYHFNQDGWDERVYGKRGQFAKNGREYKGKVVHHEGNANAKGKWFEDWCVGGKNADFAQKAYAMLLERLLERM